VHNKKQKSLRAIFAFKDEVVVAMLLVIAID